MRKLKYIVHYDKDKEEGRHYTLSATNKAEYIFSAIAENYDLTVISASLISSKGYIRGSKSKLSEKIDLIKLPAFKWGTIVEKLIALLMSKVLIFFYLLFTLKREDTVIVYHALGLQKIILFLKKLIGFELILEVEEIYNDVIQKSKRAREKEVKFLECADKYIFPTELLNNLINKKNKPYTIVYGTYRVEKDRGVSFNDNKIHVVYAGTFDPRKGGCIAAIETALYLPENYCIHILGFGNREDTDDVIKKIKEINSKSNAKVEYEGLLFGEEYIQFLQKCHIGLSTQNPDASFNATSFPSKILSYMANGLEVVTVEIPVLKISNIGRYMHFYDNQNPKLIAEAIESVILNDRFLGKLLLKELNSNFQKELKTILS